ncbi:NADPH-dependent F420 reductase [Cellvibrio sp. KY-YJ-3]|uniref:NADPH-dependent F420 reductase n=1 Tax=Cellvibrio sp. KY-YJ-3 TaxID=454662 RepID=UPI00124727B7|nr:NADPH-dependent F420 reductase [Cellvibrio sp. KY-YJ-3]QEY14041.1 NADPH-dependent F420 reductase [Cellvibrio sp. KY-YJ-3]
MKVAIIGTGNMATGLAQSLSEAKIELVIGSRDPAKAAALAAKTGASVEGGGIAAAVKLAEVIIIALPFGAVAEVLQQAGDLSNKILVDISNPISADYKSLVIGHTTSAAEEIQALAPNANVVKAFNTIFAPLLPQSARLNKTVQVFIASDDENAKTKVTQLTTAIGFKAVDAGPLRNSRFIEPIGEMNIHFGFFLGKGTAIAPAWVTL